jgi:hypothetical protein
VNRTLTVSGMWARFRWCYDFAMSRSVDHPNAAHDRERPLRRDLALVGWLWTAASVLFIAWHWVDPSNPQILVVFPLIGTTASGWTLIRTRNRRCVPLFVTSIVVLCL